MVEIDTTALVQAITDLVTIFLVTIPGIFIGSAIDGGVLFDIFVTIFDTPEVFHVVVILSLVGGVWLWFKSMDNTKTRSSAKALKEGKFR